MNEFMPKSEFAAVDELFPTFQQKFYENLSMALESGAVSEEQMKAEPYLVYRAVLQITAESYVFTNAGIKMLRDLRYYI